MGFILYEIFSGEAGSVAATGNKVSENVKTSFGTMRFIVTVGWSIYPLGYFFGYLMGGVDDDSLNLVYNLADFIKDRVLPRHLGLHQEGHQREGRQPGAPARVSRASLVLPHRYGEVFCRHRRHFSGSPSWVQVRQRLDLLECGAGADFGLRRHQFAKKKQG